jgi:5-methylcytosine-specific restriction endonuclease McrA
MDARTRKLVRKRAGERCEYCRLPETADEWPFHIDHIIARVHGGGDEPSNLSWSCTQCNLRKASNFASIDPATGEPVHLFNPREDSWHDHFALQPDGRIVGLTLAGRATVRLLDMNGTPQLDLRYELIQQGEY